MSATTIHVVVSVEVVILAVRGGRLQVLLTPRDGEPARGLRGLPGAPAGIGDLEATARWVLADVLGTRPGHLDQLRAFDLRGGPEAGRAVSIAHLALVHTLDREPAWEAAWWPVTDVLDGRSATGSDHRRIVAAALDRVGTLVEHTTAATALCAPTFTVSELRQVYEAVWNRPVDPRNFHRKVTGAEGFLASTGERSRFGAGRPAELFRRGGATALNPAMMRGQVH